MSSASEHQPVSPEGAADRDAKEQATHMSGNAAEQSKHVAGVAKDEAQQVASDA